MGYQALLNEARKKTAQHQEDRALLGKVREALVQLREDLTNVELKEDEQITSLLRALFADRILSVEISKGGDSLKEERAAVTVGDSCGIQYLVCCGVVANGYIRVGYCRVQRKKRKNPGT